HLQSAGEQDRFDALLRDPVWRHRETAGTRYVTVLEAPRAGPVWALSLLLDGSLASAHQNNTIQLWDVATGVETARFEGHTGAIYALCPLANGRLASGSRDGTIRLWDVATLAEIVRLERNAGIHALCLLADAQIASGYRDGTVGVWDVVTSTET